LAQVCAFQYWVKSREDREKAWESYLNLCKAGGERSFLGLLDLAGLKNPFDDGMIKTIVPSLKSYLDGVDDTKL
jgi:oligoendopeptidase F